MAITHLIFFLLVLSSSTSTSLTSTSSREQEKDRIKALPGQPKVGFSQFSGYVTVNESHGRSLFYWLTESSSHSPQSKPLLLWLNGGPGCSSIAYGASEEIGPFRINKTGSNLYLNSFAWNTEANLLFLESPVGVGFSYTNTSSDFKESGDERTAQENLIFLITWMSRFPQYQYRDFYIAGESYAGHYVPQLAKMIHEYSKGCQKPIINLKGFMVGNPEMDKTNDKLGTITYWWSHAMISDFSYNSILNNCNFTAERFSNECDSAIYNAAADFGDIDQYSIYTPKCVPQQQTNETTKFVQMHTTRRVLVEYDPCIEDYAEIYYNRPEVQRAMHANHTNIPYKWTACSDFIFKNWNWRDSDNSMLPIYKELIAAGLRIWVFSGDTDSVIPVTATRFTLSKLNLPIKTRWYPWYSGNQCGESDMGIGYIWDFSLQQLCICSSKSRCSYQLVMSTTTMMFGGNKRADVFFYQYGWTNCGYTTGPHGIEANYTSRSADLYRPILAKEVAKAMEEETTTSSQEASIKEEILVPLLSHVAQPMSSSFFEDFGIESALPPKKSSLFFEESDEARKKFSNAKCISSAQF